MKKLAILITLLFLTGCVGLQVGESPPTDEDMEKAEKSAISVGLIKVRETDGSPSGWVKQITVTNDQLAISGTNATMTLGGTGQAVTLDLGDDSGDDSTDLGEIATVGAAATTIFNMPSADKLEIDTDIAWPQAATGDSATAFFSAGTIEMAYGGTGQNLTDPGADRLLGWDDTDNDIRWVTIGTGLTYTEATDTLSATGTTTLEGMTDTDITGPAEHDILAWNTSDWVDLSIGGDLTGAINGSAFDLTVADNVVDIATIKDVDTSADEDILTRETTTGDFEWHTAAEILENISATQGTILYRGAAGWAALAVGVSGQYLQTQGAAANPQWASPGISGDIEDVGDVSSGAAFTADGAGNTLYFESTAANTNEVILTGGGDDLADYTVTIPGVTGTLVVGPSGFGSDNIIVKTDGTGNLTQATDISIDDSNNIDIAGTITAGSGNHLLTSAAGLIDGEKIQDDSIDEDAIDFTSITAADLTLTDATTITASGTVTGEHLVSTDDADINDALTVGNLIVDETAGTIDFTGGSAAAITASGSGTIGFGDDNLTTTGTLTASSFILGDNQSLVIGSGSDWSILYDETTDDTLEFTHSAGAGADVTFDLNDNAADSTFTITNSDGTNVANLEVEGSITSSATSGGSYVQLTDNTGGYTHDTYAMYVDAGVWKYYDTSEHTVVHTGVSPSWTGDHDFTTAGASLALPSDVPSSSGQIALVTGNELQWHDGIKVVTIDTTVTTDNYVLKYDNASATFNLEEDLTAGNPTLDAVQDPEAVVSFASDATAETVTFDFQSNFSTGSQFHITQTTGTPTGGVLFGVSGDTAAQTLARFGDTAGSNYWSIKEVSANNYQLLNAGSATLNLLAASDLLINAGQIDFDDMAQSANATPTGTWNFGGATALEIPNGTSGTTTTTGQLYLDTDGDGGDYDSPVVQISTNGATLGYIPTVAALTSTDGYILKYNATSDLLEWAEDSTGTGSLGSNLSSSTNDILSDNGAIILGGTGGSNNEKLKFDFETTTNKVLVTDDTSGVTEVDFGTINLGTDAIDLSEGSITNVDDIAVNSISDNDDDGMTISSASSTVTVESVVFTGSGISNVSTVAASGVISSSGGALSIGADAADAGAVRLSNDTDIAWENATPGTDIVALSVDGSNIVQIAESGSSGVVISASTSFSSANLAIPNSTGDLALTAVGQIGLQNTDDLIVLHGGTAGEAQGEYAISTLEHISMVVDLSWYFDQETTFGALPIMTVGDDFPNGFTITEISVRAVGGDPTTELTNTDLYCDTTPDFNIAANATKMDDLDTTAGVFTADTGFESATCGNGAFMYIDIGSDPTDDNVVWLIEIWGYAEAD